MYILRENICVSRISSMLSLRSRTCRPPKYVDGSKRLLDSKNVCFSIIFSRRGLFPIVSSKSQLALGGMGGKGEASEGFLQSVGKR